MLYADRIIFLFFFLASLKGDSELTNNKRSSLNFVPGDFNRNQYQISRYSVIYRAVKGPNCDFCSSQRFFEK